MEEHSELSACEKWKLQLVERLAWQAQLDVQEPTHAQEQNRSDFLKRRHAWFDDQLDLDLESAELAELRGSTPCGERCRAKVPQAIGEP